MSGGRAGGLRRVEQRIARADSRADSRADGDPAPTRSAVLEQLLEAFCDIADRDDIHQAADRLTLVQNWIAREAARAAADPIFAALALVLGTGALAC